MVKITDVARHAGVSPSTVSYALSGKRPISEETRRRVHASIRALGYRPPAGASVLGGGRANLLALMVPLRAGTDLPGVMPFVMSVMTTARAYDHDVLLLTREEGVDNLRRVAETASADALILMDVRLDDPRLPLLRSLGRPAVAIGVPARPTGLTCVDLDFEAAGEACVDHLAGLGHRVVALVGAPAEVYARRTASAQRVVRGFTAAVGRHGLAGSVHPCEATPAAARRVAERLLRERPAPTGVLVHHEAVLDPLLRAFAQLGVGVPDDLSVTAVCPAERAESARVPLTSVAVPSAEIGARAVELVLHRLNGDPAPSVTLLPPALTIRASTASRTAG
ncbi:LacI family DNA-binding transcriptional regulator [Streptomyces sp. NPDC001595]|uniref:LacI family DNA-binding transcriptional regulator n=1 Tax=Streptomyces sp. NPDC001532 TaxID=3154520 RepID=UPI00332C0A11